MTRNKFLTPLCALMIIMGALFFTLPAQASEISDPGRMGEQSPEATTSPENLIVESVWLTGDMLNIEVTDTQTGINQTLQVPLDEYAAGSEYVSVQAVDRNGNKSNTIQFKNPFYTPGAEPSGNPQTPNQSESGGQNGLRPFTPDGTGTVVDNVTDGDGKEFFSIQTEDGNVFYLIVDRQRSSENVYLLNAVTEDDLMSLAKDGDGKPQSASSIPVQPQPNPPPATPEPTPTVEPAAPPNEGNAGGMNNGTVIFIVVAAAAVGIAGYYFKIIRPKKQAGGGDDGADDFDDYDDEDYGDPGTEGGDEE